MIDIYSNKILIIDFGSQYTQLIARRVREIGVYCEIFSYNCLEEEIKAFKPSGIILSGGPATVVNKESPRAHDLIFNLEVPVLGICYGMHVMAKQLGGNIENSSRREFGHTQITITERTKLFGDNCPSQLNVWMSHGDIVDKAPLGFKIIAMSSASYFAAIANEEKNLYGLQFHPEVTHTKKGSDILSNFVCDICRCDKLWESKNIIDNSITNIRNIVEKDGNVILGLSGGVDSSVVAILLQKAIGNRLTCIFVDSGLLRLNEGDQIMSTFSKYKELNIIRVNAASKFFAAIENVSDPEKKRKIIGNLFIKIFEEEATKIPNAKWLAQGTIYPDVIESANSKTKNAKVIKSHHNVGGLPEHMNLKLIEPLRELFKDEVRNIGQELGLPKNIINRHPFPGPGLAIRIIGKVKKEYVNILQRADAIFIEELYAHNLYDKVSQAFAIFLPIKSVGVAGDNRQYGNVIVLRAVKTIDFMTAERSTFPDDFLDLVSTRIMNEVHDISRVTYDISSKPPATIEWE